MLLFKDLFLYTRTVKMRSDSSKKGSVHALVFFPNTQIKSLNTEKNLFIRSKEKIVLVMSGPEKEVVSNVTEK